MGREFGFEINPEDQSYIQKENFPFRNIQVQFNKNSSYIIVIIKNPQAL